MRQPKPFYRTQTRCFYVQLDDRQLNRGPDEAEAYRRWHLIMAGADESVIVAMNQPQRAQSEKPQPTTVHKLVKSFLGWVASEKKLAPATKKWHKERLESFVSTTSADLAPVIAGDELIAGDYYCIPYKAVMQMLDEADLVHDAKNAPSR